VAATGRERFAMLAWGGIAAVVLLAAVGLWEQFWRSREARRRTAALQAEETWERGRSSLDERLEG
jgi:hypothetical protein